MATLLARLNLCLECLPVFPWESPPRHLLRASPSPTPALPDSSSGADQCGPFADNENPSFSDASLIHDNDSDHDHDHEQKDLPISEHAKVELLVDAPPPPHAGSPLTALQPLAPASPPQAPLSPIPAHIHHHHHHDGSHSFFHMHSHGTSPENDPSAHPTPGNDPSMQPTSGKKHASPVAASASPHPPTESAITMPADLNVHLHENNNTETSQSLPHIHLVANSNAETSDHDPVATGSSSALVTSHSELVEAMETGRIRRRDHLKHHLKELHDQVKQGGHHLKEEGSRHLQSMVSNMNKHAEKIEESGSFSMVRHWNVS